MTLRPIEEVVEEYINNGNFEATASVAAARLRLTAAMELVTRRPSKVMIDGNQMQFDFVALREEISYLRNWLASSSTSTANPSTSALRTYDMSDMRR